VGSADPYDASALATKSNSIVVTINYRLGLFGFYVLPELIQESAVLNYGLQDQQKALQWVQLNIVSFGGKYLSISALFYDCAKDPYLR